MRYVGYFSCGMRTLSCGMHEGSRSLSREQTWAPCIGSVESYPLDHKGSPYSILKNRGFPGGTVVENLPANAGDMGSSPGLGRSHMPRSRWAREPQLLSLRVWSLCSATREAAIMRGPRTAMKSGPHLPQLEKSPRTETKTQHSHK